MAPTVRESTTEESTVTVEATPTAQTGRSAREGVYEVPIIRASVPERLVDGGFWAALAALAVTGAVDPPLALLLGAGVVVARHRRSERNKPAQLRAQ